MGMFSVNDENRGVNGPSIIRADKNANTKIFIKAKIKDHSYLVLNDIYYPGWSAKIDGAEAEILPANYIVRSLELYPGEYDIEFYYDPLPYKIGAIISIVALLISAGFMVKLFLMDLRLNRG